MGCCGYDGSNVLRDAKLIVSPLSSVIGVGDAVAVGGLIELIESLEVLSVPFISLFNEFIKYYIYILSYFYFILLYVRV